jgi:hypothetical protein
VNLVARDTERRGRAAAGSQVAAFSSSASVDSRGVRAGEGVGLEAGDVDDGPARIEPFKYQLRCPTPKAK